MDFWGFFQSHVLINCFMPPRQAEAIAREICVRKKRDSSSLKEIQINSIAGIQLFACNCKI